MIRLAERETYETAWALPQYAEHAPGVQYAKFFQEMAGARSGQTVLDAGCGSGKGALELRARGFSVTLCDLTPDGLVSEARGFPFIEACLWDDLQQHLGYVFGRKFDWVYCCDVLEHIPPVFAMLVVSRLLAVARKGVFLSISTVQDQFGPWVGKAALHQTVQDFGVWKAQLEEVADVVEARDLLIAGLYLVKPRC